MAQVVARRGSADRARVGAAAPAESWAARLQAPRHQPPQALCRGDDGREQRPLDAYRVVVAADCASAASSSTTLMPPTATRPSIVTTLRCNRRRRWQRSDSRRSSGGKSAPGDAGLAQARHQARRRSRARQTHPPSPRRPLARRAPRNACGDAPSGAVVFEDVALREDLALGISRSRLPAPGSIARHSPATRPRCRDTRISRWAPGRRSAPRGRRSAPTARRNAPGLAHAETAYVDAVGRKKAAMLG